MIGGRRGGREGGNDRGVDGGGEWGNEEGGKGKGGEGEGRGRNERTTDYKRDAAPKRPNSGSKLFLRIKVKRGERK